ncbi:MAG: solute:sodium symporter family transporter [Pseudomonadales bacterium]
MNGADVSYTIATCIGFMALVAGISYLRTRGEVDTQDGYFLAGRGLTGTFIAGSLLLTNLSAEQLIGLNGSAFGFNMTSMAWEVTAGIAIIVMALYFLPKYLGGAFSTLPQFLESRYDVGVRRMTVVLFLFGYGLITIPSVLYSGSLAVLQLFDVPRLLGTGHEQALVVTILLIGIVGGLYAVFGGLRAVAVSDTINGIGLLIIGVLVPVFGLLALGQGDIAAGLDIVLTEDTHKLNAIGSAEDPTPFATLFTGMILANLFYWGTNQYVIQRTLGAKNLAEGQKGVLLSGFFKLLVPFFMMLPGLIAYHLYDGQLRTMDLAYPRLVADVLPLYLSGFFLAVLLGAVFSSFNSLLNSAATLYCLDVHQPLLKKPISDAALIRVAKIVSLIIALFSFAVAPLLQYAPEGLWQIIRVFTGFYNIPVITIVLVGLFTRRVPARAAKVVIVFHVVAYGLLKFAWPIDLHFIHLYAVLFAIEVGIMLLVGRVNPRPTSWRYVSAQVVDMTPWRYALPTAILLAAGIVLIYVLFSPIGLVGGAGPEFYWTVAALLIAAALLCRLSMTRWNARYRKALAVQGLNSSVQAASADSPAN